MTARPGLPVWATLSTSGLEQVALPASVNRIVILADHDASGAGLRAAETAARRLRSEGREVVIAMPSREGDDFNDLLRGRGRGRRAGHRGGRDATEDDAAPMLIGRHRPQLRRSPTRACRSCAPTRAISGARSRRPGACCSPRTARPGSTATPASRPGSCPTTRPPGRRHPDRGAPASHAGPPRRLAAHERKGELVPAPPRTAVVKSVLATPDPGLPVLVGIVNTPVFGRNGTLLTAPTIRTRGCSIRPGSRVRGACRSPRPTPADVAAARALICDELLGDFPFVSPPSAHAVALLLLGFLRGMVDGPRRCT